MDVRERFNNVFSYVAEIEKWCNNNYENFGGTSFRYTFCNDFIIADWYNADSVKETYERVKAEWLTDYNAFTEVVVSLNLLVWANQQLMKQGISGRQEFVELYSDLYCKAKNDFMTSEKATKR